MENSNLRKKWMGLLAKAPVNLLSELYQDVVAHLPNALDFKWLRQPEIGGVMVKGRAGATGAAFNMGEMTVTRCSLKLQSGEVGHAYVQGRDKTKAEQAAIIDALMQTDKADMLNEKLLQPIEARLRQTRNTRDEKAQKTKVDFFTLVRGED